MASEGWLVMRTLKLQPNERQALQAFIRKICDKDSEQIVQTILFGSAARGDGSPDSDIDVLVIVKDQDDETRTQILTVAARISLDHDVLLNPVIVSEGRYQRQQSFTFFQNV